jgi:type IV pilus assembly protein PilM
MFDRELVAVELGHEYIKILAGSKNKVKCCGTIKTPEEAFDKENIVNVQKLSKAIAGFLKERNINTKRISFTVHGQDIVVRHMETPIMDNKGILKSLQWEIAQYLPEEGRNYYNDYEIIDKIITKEKKVYNVMVVSVPKEKIDKYVALANKLRMNLSAIDIAPNNVSRVFRNVHKLKKRMDSIGIMQIGLYNSNFTILEKGRLFIQRDIPFGVNNVSEEMFPFGKSRPEESAKNFLRVFNFYGEEENTVDSKIKHLFDEAFYSFDTIIQYYSTGKTNKALDMIYIIGEGAEIKGLDDYVQNHFSADVEIVEASEEIGIKTKLPKECSFKYYVNNIGLLLRKE